MLVERTILFLLKRASAVLAEHLLAHRFFQKTNIITRVQIIMANDCSKLSYFSLT